jgi:hypothetical protein
MIDVRAQVQVQVGLSHQSSFPCTRISIWAAYACVRACMDGMACQISPVRSNRLVKK